ncbi:Crp/Fnr family transcriptional regulator [Aquabacterium parvum]|uniref:Crp/Fnr family transcriptional regulator n=1 Tax=Aquabacterium parvum TaxID=70584 RepID=UPI00128EB6EE|nr:Crp/Fnr family transcriptional regulator [Aquabacterium parvum]MBU0915680.1 Crp/Fnr family transcriptional regulator [Gammaproteobacteria bacterium]
MSAAPAHIPAAEWQAFVTGMNALSPLNDEDLADAAALCQRLSLDKGQALLRAGEQASLVGFVVSGGLREHYVLADGGERTKGFSLPGWFAGSLSDLISGDVSKVWIEAAAPTVLLTLPWTDVRRWQESRPAWTRFGWRVAERLYMMKVEREYELLAMDAAARLHATLARWPTLEQVFSQRDIASYVGVTPVHLSRLRTSKSTGQAKAGLPAPGSPPSR